MGKKYIHYCWFGDKKLSRLAKKCIKSWKKYLPDYEVICWNEKNSNLEECPFVKEAYEQKKWAFVADYVRTKAIYEYGGIYFDTDMLIKKDISELLKNKAFLGVEDSGAVAVGVWWADSSKSWLAKELLDFYQKQEHFKKDDLYSIAIPVLMANILQKYGFERGLKENQIINGVNIYTRDYFYPLSYNYHDNDFTDNTCMIHYYDASWTSKTEQRTIGLIRKFGESRAKKILFLGHKIKSVLIYYGNVIKNTARLICYPAVFLIKKRQFNKKFDKNFKELNADLVKVKQKKYVVFYNQNWLGTSAAAKNLFKEQAIALMEDFRDGQAELIADTIIKNGYRMIIFSAFTGRWGELAKILRRKNPDIIIKEYWQGSNAMHIEDFDFQLFNNVFGLLNNGVFNSVIFAKKSMYEQYRKIGYNVEFISNIVSIDKKIIAKKQKHDKICVGIYSSGDRWVKNFYNQIAATSLLDDVSVDIIPLSKKIEDFAKILKINITGEYKTIKHTKLLERISKNDVVLYTTFTECAPITPLECLEMGVICITGPNHHYWEGNKLEEFLVEPKVDNPVAIANRVKKCLNNKEEIFRLYKVWKKQYDKDCKKLLEKVLTN